MPNRGKRLLLSGILVALLNTSDVAAAAVLTPSDSPSETPTLRDGEKNVLPSIPVRVRRFIAKVLHELLIPRP